MKKTYIILLASLLVSLAVIAQENTQKSIDNFKKSTQAKITINKNLGIPSFVKFPVNKPLSLSGNGIVFYPLKQYHKNIQVPKMTNPPK